MLDIAMPQKIRLLAMKTLLSARLAEGRIIIVDNDYLQERKTKLAEQSMRNFNPDDRYVYIAGYISEDFKIASRNIQRVNYTTFDKVTLTEILKADKVMFNLDGILNMMLYLHEKTVMLNKPKAVRFKGKLHISLSRAKLAGKPKTKKVPSFYLACV